MKKEKKYTVIYYDTFRGRWYAVTQLSLNNAKNVALQLISDQDESISCVQITEVLFCWDETDGITEGEI